MKQDGVKSISLHPLTLSAAQRSQRACPALSLPKVRPFAQTGYYLRRPRRLASGHSLTLTTPMISDRSTGP